MICSKCGAQVPENSRFCPVCGAPAAAPAQQPQQPAQQSAPDLFGPTYNTAAPAPAPTFNSAPTKAPAGSLGGFKLPSNMMELVFPAATVLFSILTLIFWICSKIKLTYKYESYKRVSDYSVKEYLEQFDKEAIFTVFLILGILLIVALIGISVLQVLGIGDKRTLQMAGIACAALIFLLFLIYVLIVKGAYKSYTKSQMKEFGLDSKEIREELKDLKKHLKIGLAGTGILTFFTAILAGAAQAAGIFLAPSKD